MSNGRKIEVMSTNKLLNQSELNILMLECSTRWSSIKKRFHQMGRFGIFLENF